MSGLATDVHHNNMHHTTLSTYCLWWQLPHSSGHKTNLHQKRRNKNKKRKNINKSIKTHHFNKNKQTKKPKQAEALLSFNHPTAKSFLLYSKVILTQNHTLLTKQCTVKCQKLIKPQSRIHSKIVETLQGPHYLP